MLWVLYLINIAEETKKKPLQNYKIYHGLEAQCEESLLLGFVYHFKKKDGLIKAIKKLELMHIL